MASISITPSTRRNNSILSQRSVHNDRPAPPINESMVREHLSVNLPDSYNYLSNTLPMGRGRRPRSHRPRSRSNSSSGSRASTRSVDSAGAPAHRADNVESHRGRGGRSPRPLRRSRPPSSSSSGARSSSSRSTSTSSRSSNNSSDNADVEYTFYARLVKVGRNIDGSGVGGEHGSSNHNHHHGSGGSPVAQCCDAVRDAVRLLQEARVCPGDDGGDGDSSFFWLDLHGVPPPLPNTAAWRQRPQRWRRRERASRRAGTDGEAQEDVSMRELWTALQLQPAMVNTLGEVCEQWQADPRPSRISLDDVYEEEMSPASNLDDKVVQVAPVQTPPAPPSETSDAHAHDERAQRGQEQRQEAKSNLTRRGGLAAPAHYVVLELRTLLTSVPVSAATVCDTCWETPLLATATAAAAYAHEPLNDMIWKDGFEENMRRISGVKASGSRAVIADTSLLQTHESTVTPLITSTYVVCFPTGCVTWCPASTLGLTSADRRAQRSAAADEHRRRRAPDTFDDVDGAQADVRREDSDVGDVQYVKSWEQVQASVFHRLRAMAVLQRDYPTTPAASDRASCGGGGGRSTRSASSSSERQKSPMCTSDFVSLLLSAVCYAYLPRSSSVVGEVDAIDSMLPLIRLNLESDQADALRRVLLLRRRLALHRRLLFQKMRLLEALDRPVMHTVARFLRTLDPPSWMRRGTAVTGAAMAGHHIPLDAAAGSSRQSSSRSGGYPPVGEHRTSLDESSRGVAETRAEHPWSSAASEQLHDIATRQARTNLNDKAVLSPLSSDYTARSRPGVVPFHTTPGALTAPPSLSVIHTGIGNVMRDMEAARTVLGNTTLIYSSSVNFNNSRTSEQADYFGLLCQFMLLVVLPLSIVASQWGMNCPVPFMNIDNLHAFWGIIGIMLCLGVAGFVVPLYAYKTGRMYLIS